MPLLDPARGPTAVPAPDGDAILFLELRLGFQCSQCPKMLCDTKSIGGRLRTAHMIVKRGPGRATI